MRGFLATLLVPLAIVSGAAALRVADPPALESLRLGFYDELQRQAPRPWTDPGVRIVDIDDESLAKIGQWPWPRTVVAALTEKVVERGAAAIAFDIVFAEPDRTSPRAVLPLWAEAAERPDLLALARELPDHDRVFAEILAATPSVLGTAPAGAATREIPRKWALAYGGPDPRPSLSTYPGAIANLPELERGAKGIGSFGTGVERDGVVRRVPLFVRIRGDRADADASREVYPSLVAEILRVAQGEQDRENRADENQRQDFRAIRPIGARKIDAFEDLLGDLGVDFDAGGDRVERRGAEILQAGGRRADENERAVERVVGQLAGEYAPGGN